MRRRCSHTLLLTVGTSQYSIIRNSTVLELPPDSGLPKYLADVRADKIDDTLNLKNVVFSSEGNNSLGGQVVLWRNVNNWRNEETNEFLEHPSGALTLMLTCRPTQLRGAKKFAA